MHRSFPFAHMKESVKCGASQLVDEVPQADGDAHGDKVDAHGVEEWRGRSPVAFFKADSSSKVRFSDGVCISSMQRVAKTCQRQVAHPEDSEESECGEAPPLGAHVRCGRCWWNPHCQRRPQTKNRRRALKSFPFPGQAPALWVQPPALNQKVQARVGGTQLEVQESSF